MIPLIVRMRKWVVRVWKGIPLMRRNEMDLKMYKQASNEARDNADLSTLITSKEKLACRYYILKKSGMFPDLTLARMKRSIEDLSNRITARTREIVQAARGQVRKEAAALAGHE